MPLKHKTETRLIVLLGAVTLLAGVLASLLPAFPFGAGPWALCFAVAIIYPVLLHPMLKKNRADYEFRLLHWMPAAMFVLWFALQILQSTVESTAFLSSWFSWAWTLPLVTIGFFLLIVFCLHVIRRRTSRIILLAVLFVPYAAFALLGEQGTFTYNQQMASVLWNENFWSRLLPESETGTTKIAVVVETKTEVPVDTETNLEPSDDPQEEAWRASLRAFQKRMSDLVAKSESSASAESTIIAKEVLPKDLQPGGSGAHMRTIASRPNNLPASGFGWNAFMIIMLATYCGVLHDRMRRRVS